MKLWDDSDDEQPSSADKIEKVKASKPKQLPYSPSKKFKTVIEEAGIKNKIEVIYAEKYSKKIMSSKKSLVNQCREIIDEARN